MAEKDKPQDETLRYSSISRELKKELRELLTLAQKHREAGSEKNYRTYIDAVWKIGRVLVDINNLQKSSKGDDDKPDEDILSIFEKWKLDQANAAKCAR